MLTITLESSAIILAHWLKRSQAAALQPSQNISVHLPREGERNTLFVCVCVGVCVRLSPLPAFGSTVSFWFRSCWRERERERENDGRRLNFSPALSPTNLENNTISLSLTHFLFFTQTFCPESPQAASSIFPIISYL